MDVIKAQRLMVKIQAFLDHGNGNELSRLEKDLVKTYIIQLYDAVTSEETTHQSETLKPVEVPVTKTQWIETPPVYVPEMPKIEPFNPVFSEVSTPKVAEKPIEVKIIEPESVTVYHKPEPKPVQIQIKETIRETVQNTKVASTPQETSEALSKLFELPKTEEVSDRFSHIPLPSIESGMGLNEKIFTLNELFGGDKGLFDITCAELNTLSSFSEAKSLLLNGPARHFNWSDPVRIKMAEQFIRIVARRYPRS